MGTSRFLPDFEGQTMTKRRIVLGISGASGFQYGYKALQLLQDIENVETHLVVSKGAELARALETSHRQSGCQYFQRFVQNRRNAGRPLLYAHPCSRGSRLQR